MNIEALSKDELKVYASSIGIELDMRKKLSDLIDEVKKKGKIMIDGEEIEAEDIIPASRYIMNTKTGLVFESTPQIEIHKKFTPELVYCDAKGDKL